MKNHYTFLLLLTFALFSYSSATGQDNNTSKPARPTTLPDDPCEVLNQARMSAITGLEVTSVRRVPSIEKIIQAQDENREPDPGTICSYETRSDFGAIAIVIPAQTGRSAAAYWENRTEYFKTFPGSAQPVPGLGMDAWLSGGTSLHVLVREGEQFAVLTQMYRPESRELLVKIARAILEQLQSRAS